MWESTCTSTWENYYSDLGVKGVNRVPIRVQVEVPLCSRGVYVLKSLRPVFNTSAWDMSALECLLKRHLYLTEVVGEVSC